MGRKILTLLAVLLLGAVLRLVGLGAKSLWYDEAVSTSFLGFSISETIQRCGEPRATSPPLYFLILKAWASIWGDSQFVLRAPAFLFGLVAMSGVFALNWELPRVVGVGRVCPSAAGLAAALAALSPLHIQLSQQVRGYSMAVALQVWSGWALIKALRGGRREGAFWIVAGLLATCSCYTHYIGLFTVLAQGLFAAGYLAWARKGRESGSSKPQEFRLDENATATTNQRSGAFASLRPSTRWALVGSATFSVGFLLPWLLPLIVQARTVGHHPRLAPPAEASYLAAQVSQAVLGTSTSPWQGPDVGDRTIPVLLGVLFLMLVVRGGWPGAYFVLTGLVAPLLMIASSFGSGWTMSQARYLSFAQISWLSGAALLIGRIPHKPERTLLSAWLLGWSAYACFENWDVIGPASKPGIRAATRFILENRQRDEPIVAQTPYVFFGACYYARGQVKPLLCATSPKRETQFGSEQLRDEDLITLDSLRSAGFAGFWLLSCTSFTANGIYDVNLPRDWTLVDVWSFDQDHLWETPVVVKHYVREGKYPPTPTDSSTP